MGISEELYILWSAVWTGCVICGVHEALCLLRRIIKHTDRMVGVEDFLFWVGTTVFVFQKVFEVNNGSWRWYFALGIVVGVWAVHTIWSGLEKVVRKLKKSLKNKG